jgi:hypothetical protein
MSQQNHPKKLMENMIRPAIDIKNTFQQSDRFIGSARMKKKPVLGPDEEKTDIIKWVKQEDGSLKRKRVIKKTIFKNKYLTEE